MDTGLDPKIVSLASRLVESNHTHDEGEGDDEVLFSELEAEIENDDNAAMREQGLKFFKREIQQLSDMKANEHGQYTEIMDETEVVRVTAKEPRCVVHFYHPDFKRCEIMDKHLAKLAPKYFLTRFFRVFVENIPWLVEKLGIKILPCVICFVDGVTKHRIIGFEELGNIDVFETAALELRLSMAGVLQKTTSGPMQSLYQVSSRAVRARGDDDEVFDLDE